MSMYPPMSILANPFKFTGLLATPSLLIVLVGAMPVNVSGPWTTILLQMVGNVIGFCLYGALTVQLYIYYISFPNDAKGLKATIYVIYLTETVYTVMLAYDLTRLVLHPSKESLTNLLVPVCGGLVALLTQAVYAYRIYIITQAKLIPLCIIVLMAFGIVFIAVSIPLHLSFYIVSLVSSVSSLVADFTIAFFLIRTLTKQPILSNKLRRRIARLVHIIIGCGILTVVVNVATLVTSLYSLDATLSCGIILSKLYANGSMVLINDRTSHSGDKAPSLDDMATMLERIPKSQDEQSLNFNSSDSRGTCESKEQVQDRSLHV